MWNYYHGGRMGVCISLTQFLVKNFVNVVSDYVRRPADLDHLGFLKFAEVIARSQSSYTRITMLLWIRKRPLGIERCEMLVQNVMAKVIVCQIPSHYDRSSKCLAPVANKRLVK